MSAGDLRASDADRDRVADVLHAAYAEGRITPDEHSERTAALTRARTFAELTTLTADLVPGPVVGPLAHPPAAWPTADQSSTGIQSYTGDPADTGGDRVIAMLTSGKRVGPWRVGRSTAANVCLGDALFDLTEATFAADRVELNCTVVAGMVKVRVPLGTNVVVEVANVLGSSSVKDIGPPDPGMPTVVIRGLNFMGDIQVRGPKKPPPWRRHVT